MSNSIKKYQKINEFFEATGFELRTDIPDFFVFSFSDIPNKGIMSMSPYQKDFYHITLVLNAKKSKITIDEQKNTLSKNFLYFLSPMHIFTWKRDLNIKVYTVFFKPSFLNLYNGSLELDFSFFNLTENNMIELSPDKINMVFEDFEKLYKEYNTSSPYRIQILQSLVLSLLFKSKGIQEEFYKCHNLSDRKQAIVYKFINLVSNLYISLKQVGNYAEILGVSPNALNQIVKNSLGKTAKEIISEKIILESKRMLIYTTNDISVIAFNLGFDEPTHFIRFFKNRTLQTPKEYRLCKM